MPFAPQGKRDGESAESMLSFASWCSLNLALQHKIITGENSDKCRKDMLVKTHGHMYAVMSLILCGTRSGWPVRRDRLYAVMIHKGH